MMQSTELTQEHKQQVAAWIAEGEGLSGVQKRLHSELGINMTFIEVRFMVDDLDLELQDKAQPEPAAAPAPAATARAAEVLDDDAVVPFPQEANDAIGAVPSGDVSISVDKLQRPGAVISGTVTFSDGVSASWQIDQLGRLGLIPKQEGYQPSEDDIAKFQAALQTELQKKGF